LKRLSERYRPTARRAARAAMALAALSGDEQCIIFSQLCNVLDPGIAVAFGSASGELWALTQAQQQQLRADHEVAAALCRKLGKRSCKELPEAKSVDCSDKGLSAADLATLGTLGSVLPALETLILTKTSAGPDGVPRLAERLGAGALPVVTFLDLSSVQLGDAGASALSAALGRGALPRLETLGLMYAAIGDAGLVALAPALRRRPALEALYLGHNPFYDEGLAALLAPPPPPAGAPPPPTGVLAKLKTLDLRRTHITDAGLVALAPALRRLPALEELDLIGNPFGDEGLAALVAPPPAAGAPAPPTGVLTKLRLLDLDETQIADAGCAALASALDSGVLPALEVLGLEGIPASDASTAAVTEALARTTPRALWRT
jgi:hypothetical protein